MNTVQSPTVEVSARPPLRRGARLGRLVLIGFVLAGIVGAFGFLGGWLTPGRLTPARFVDAFERANGVHPGFRRNHAKGLGVAGYFDSNGNGQRLSKATVFRPGRVSVIGRFSLSGGRPYAADNPGVPRAMALEFRLPHGELWRTAMVNVPVFAVRTPEAFYEQMIAARPDPATGKPDAAKMDAFLARHPETVQAMAVIRAQPPASGFEDSTFHSLNAFRFINATGDVVAVRWEMAPLRAAEPSDTPSPSADKNAMFDQLLAAMHRAPLRWRLVVIVAQPGDPTNDASVAWPADRERVDLGTLTLDHAESDDTSPARDINFDPLVLPDGVAPSDDPLLSARSSIYARSFTRREGEPKHPAAVTPADARKGD
jgi:catalase